LVLLTWICVGCLPAVNANVRLWEIVAVSMLASALAAMVLALLAVVVERPRWPAVAALLLTAAFPVSAWIWLTSLPPDTF
jgi:hypothetical protein